LPPRTHPAARKWAYTWRGGPNAYLSKFYTPAQWEAANNAREIKDLTARIRDGKGWLATIPTHDPQYAQWACKLAELTLKRNRLQAIANARKLQAE
jgi:hypothetical protein